MPDPAAKPLPRRFIADVGAGLIAGAAVSPVISAVDKALAENASGKAQLVPSFLGSLKDCISRPVQFARSPAFLYIWLVYGSTYIAANTVTSYCDAKDRAVAIPKLLSTFVVNTGTCIVKDRAFARMYGSSAAAAATPPGAYAAWLSRDLLSMGVIFTLPPIVAKKVAEQTGNEKQAYYVAQFGLPLVLQTVTTPLHLLGYDVANNPTASAAERISFLQKDYFKNVGMRMVRMVPPWSIGTIGNKELRDVLTRYV